MSSTVGLFYDEFSSFLETIILSPEKLLLTGDFNIHVDNKSDLVAQKFVDILDSFNLCQHIDGPTHENGQTLDLIITRSDQMFAMNFTVYDPAISDHLALHCNTNLSKLPNVKCVITYRKLCSINHDIFRCDILNSSLCQLPKKCKKQI